MWNYQEKRNLPVRNFCLSQSPEPEGLISHLKVTQKASNPLTQISGESLPQLLPICGNHLALLFIYSS